MIYQDIINRIERGEKQVVVLVDPDKCCEESVKNLVARSNDLAVSMFLVGGSILNRPVEKTIERIKSLTEIPVVIFPGNLMQLSEKADGILLLSLISGRNPDFLIGNHVNAATFIKNSGIEVIPTGYILIESGKTTSVEYMSNTKPIPANKTDIAVATALAGEMLGNKLIYLEAGSGADNPVNEEMIRKVKENISVPLIVGGGISTREEFKMVKNAGADIIVLGNILEKDPDFLNRIL